MPLPTANDDASVTDTDDSSTVHGDDTDSVMIIPPSEEEAAPQAHTLACNGPNCPVEVFGDIKVYPTKCCHTMICELCIARSRREGLLCPVLYCRAPLESGGPLFLSDDPSEVRSKERDIRRTMMLEASPRYKEIVEDGKVLKAKVALQKDQIEEHNRMHSILADQIVQSSNRVEAITHEADTCKSMIQQLLARTQTVEASNDSLRAEIQAVKAKVVSDLQMFQGWD
ncbi:hypothetical protein NMY22_g12484 [Coprinellus aureogranulatus]|nr:hypothetical protein NMY22_g12484 [Coprinellus aureogranulatus]